MGYTHTVSLERCALRTNAIRAPANWYLISELGYAGYRNESIARIRGFGLAAGVIADSGDGLYDPRRGDDHRRARLLPLDELPVRTDADVQIEWLLPEDSPERSR
jgi:hypothetical protein